MKTLELTTQKTQFLYEFDSSFRKKGNKILTHYRSPTFGNHFGTQLDLYI